MKNKIVLFVDDEISILNSLKRQFRKTDFDLLTAAGGKAGMEILENNDVTVIISDERMPGMSGIEFFQQVKRSHPDAVRIILSGYADSEAIVDAINKGEVFRFLVKPWKQEELDVALEQAFAHYDLTLKNKLYMEKIIAENRKLKEKMTIRDSELIISQEIIDKMPMPIALINQHDELEMCNTSFRTVFSDMPQGLCKMRRVFSEESADRILAGFSSSGGQETVRVAANQSLELDISIRSFRLSDNYRGMIVIGTGNGRNAGSAIWIKK